MQILLRRKVFPSRDLQSNRKGQIHKITKYKEVSLGVRMEVGTGYHGDTVEGKVNFTGRFTEVVLRPSHKLVTLVSFSQLHQFYSSYSSKINENNLITKILNGSSQTQQKEYELYDSIKFKNVQN